jgi:arylsulfatase A-like enzyme
VIRLLRILIAAWKTVALVACLFLFTQAGAASNRTDKPNVIIILTDDQGHADVGFNGCTDIPTPHVDSIARNGVLFRAAYVTYPVCSPSRAGLLTGRYQQRFGHERNPRFEPDSVLSGLPLSETTLADALKKVGYHCGIIGKWHLGAHPQFHPLKRGFDEFFGHLGGGHRYFPEDLTIKETAEAKNEEDSYRLWILRNHIPVRTTQYLTDEFSHEAVGFVERNKDRPFFLYLAYNAPHGPLQAPPEYLSRFPDTQNLRRQTYAGMVSAVDDGVGRLLGKLREIDLEQKTLIFFLSDNGGPPDANASDNSPLRGAKGSIWEGGWRVPFAAQWPALLPKGAAYDHPVSALDIFATVAGITGAPVDPQRPLDGVNLIPYLTGAKSGVPHQALYLRMHDKAAFAVRSGDYKLVIPGQGAEPELYNIVEDIEESNNLAGSHAAKLAALEKMRVAWEAQLVPPIFPGLEQPRRPVARASAVGSVGTAPRTTTREDRKKNVSPN